MHMNKRLTVTFSDEQIETLERVAALEQSSASNVVRDCVRAMLPQLLAVSEFVYDPRNSPADVVAFADQMERALGLLEAGAQGVAGVPTGDEATPARRRYTRPKPPSSNTGVNPAPEPGN